MVGDEAPLARQMVWPVSASTGAGLKALVHWIGPLLKALGAGGDSPRFRRRDAGRPGRLSPVKPRAAVLGVPEGMTEGTETPWDDLEVGGRGGGHVLYQPTGTSERSFVVRQVKKGFVVEGEVVRRLVRRFDLDNEEAIRYVAEKFDRLGVYAALRATGSPAGRRRRRRGLRLRVQLKTVRGRA